MEGNYKDVKFETLANGEAAELFTHELGKVVENIQDFNTEPTGTREIVLKVKIKPNSERRFGSVDISCHSKLSGKKPAQTVFHFDQDGKQVYEPKMKQPSLFNEEEKPTNVVDYKSRAAGEREEES